MGSALYFLRPKFHLKALLQLRQLTTFSWDALEHGDCAIHNKERQSVYNVVDDDDDDDDDDGNDCWLPMMMTMMMVVEMKRVLRDLVKMRKLRTFPHKESCNLFSSIKFEQQILNS